MVLAPIQFQESDSGCTRQAHATVLKPLPRPESLNKARALKNAAREYDVVEKRLIALAVLLTVAAVFYDASLVLAQGQKTNYRRSRDEFVCGPWLFPHRPH